MVKDSNEIDNDLMEIADFSIIDLSKVLVEKSGSDQGKIEETKRSLEKITKSYSSFTKRVNKQSVRSQVITNFPKQFQLAGGPKEKAMVVGRTATAYLRKIPIANYALSKIGAQDIPVHVVLKDQANIATAISEKLKDFIFSEYGTKTTINNIYTQKEAYIGQGKIIKEQYQKLRKEHIDIKSDLEKNISIFDQKYDKAYDNINPMDIKPDDEGLYHQIAGYQTKLKKKELDIQEEKSKFMILATYIAGTKILCEHIELLHDMGSTMYTKMDGFLKNASPNIAILGDAVQLDQLMIEGSKIVHEMVENFNEAMLMATENIKTLAYHTDTLIPAQLMRPETLVKSHENIQQAKQNLLIYQGTSIPENKSSD